MKLFDEVRQAGAFPVFGVFFAEAFVLGNWIPRIPDIKSQFDMSASDLGAALFVLSAGTLVSFFFSGWLVRKLGFRVTNTTANSIWAIFIGSVPFMPSYQLACISLFCAGISVGLQEVSMNSTAEDVANRSGLEIMSRCHGFWSVGSMVGALCGASFAALEFSTAAHFALVMPVAIMMSIIIGLRTRDAVTKSNDDGAASAFKLPSRNIALLCIMPIGIMLVEGAFIDWSAVFVKSVLQGSAISIGLIYASFSLVMAAVRLSGDSIVAQFGAVRVARLSALSAMIGISMFALAPNTTVAFVAAALSGIGVAICYPIAVSAAARRPGNAEDNVAAISMFAFTSFMAAPPIIGFLADAYGLRIALLCIVPIAATSYVLSSELGSQRGKNGQSN